MTSIHTAFSKSYAEARQKFLSAAQQAGLQVESHVHPEKGRDGEELAMDVVREGPLNAQHVLLSAALAMVLKVIAAVAFKLMPFEIQIGTKPLPKVVWRWCMCTP
jgi:hypothetical protein